MLVECHGCGGNWHYEGETQELPSKGESTSDESGLLDGIRTGEAE